MMPIRSMAALLILSLVACSRATPPMATATCTSQPTLAPAPTNTPDVCAGATDSGARQRFTLEQIVPCLNTISQASAFMASNVKYDIDYDTRERGGNEYVPAWIVYERGIDDADGHAILQCYLLEENGWDAFIIGLSIESPTGSNVCGVNTNGAILIWRVQGKWQALSIL